MESLNILAQGIINLFKETYNIMFIVSILFIVYIIFDLVIKVVGRFHFKNENIIFKLTDKEKIVLWLSLSVMIAYIF